jgi:hypothetical protein
MSIGVPKAEERRDPIANFKEQKGELKREEVRMSDWLGDVIGADLIAVYEGLYFTEDALLWLREKPRTFGELRAEEIDWLRWMAANVRDEDILEKLSEDPDTDVRMWVACNPVTLNRPSRSSPKIRSFSSAEELPKTEARLRLYC